MAISKILLFANPRPSNLLKRMRKHDCDVSVGSKGKVMAHRTILGKNVTFYENGLRVVDDKDLSEDDEHHSEVLRLAHASLLINDAVGDKNICYVDARVDPVEVHVYGMPAEEFIKQASKRISSGELDKDFVLGMPLRQTKEFENEQNVKLFGR